jgi:hypothetical protein
MADYVSENITRLLFETQNLQAVANAQHDVDATKASIDRLTESFRANAIGQVEFEKKAAPLLATLQNQQTRLTSLTAATGNTAAAMDKYKWGILEAGRATQDFAQGGLGGILNNLERITTGFGGSAGLAAAVTVAGVAFLALKPLVQAVITSFDTSADSADTDAKALKGLAAAAQSAADQFKSLADARTKAFDAGKIGSGPASEVMGKAFSDAAKSTIGSEGLFKGLAQDPEFRRHLPGVAALERTVAENQVEAERARKLGVPEEANVQGKRVREAQAEIDRKVGEAAQQEVGAAMSGEAPAIQRFMKRAAAHPGQFGAEFGAAVAQVPRSRQEVIRRQTAAEARKHQEEADKALDQEDEGMAKVEEAQAKREDEERDRRAEALEKSLPKMPSVEEQASEYEAAVMDEADAAAEGARTEKLKGDARRAAQRALLNPWGDAMGGPQANAGNAGQEMPDMAGMIGENGQLNSALLGQMIRAADVLRQQNAQLRGQLASVRSDVGGLAANYGNDVQPPGCGLNLGVG